MGRFLTADPVAMKLGDIYNFNRPAYANNDPVNGLDPDGEVTCDDTSCTLESTTIAGRGLEYIYVGTIVAARLIENAFTGSSLQAQQSQSNTDGQVHVAPALPTGLIGDKPREMGKYGGTGIGTSLPSYKFADIVKALTGELSPPPKAKNEASLRMELAFEQVARTDRGPRTEVTANDTKLSEVIYFPENTPIPDSLKPMS